ncbi:uncharacterized protein CCOS01_03035 [Colletotrichum costaricense]|uniref:Uncharacterized protein n=2 Tax=Colletotrichum acutatum species complex TaxID=2707335 RepID=A0AAI9Z4J8_9PEZI|nr:uncharacterized protein CCOS01_03035 [Colletotrichum costaricense]XP_060386951.1 uncharacterized protein CTAM01_02279 [Colletotrichum tamarilloi]KAK1508493.1 hypothetical protein CTAM01_02279 [Colletotrichum tamarilloi]KAK1534283.1 hypothetical protein CCOS01_03035 [Colletotrichum costaricense]
MVVQGSWRLLRGVGPGDGDRDRDRGGYRSGTVRMRPRPSLRLVYHVGDAGSEKGGSFDWRRVLSRDLEGGG